MLVSEVERAASKIVGLYSKKEKNSMLTILERVSRTNRPWEAMKVEYGPCDKAPKPPSKRMKPAGNVGSEVTVTSKKAPKKSTPKALIPQVDNPTVKVSTDKPKTKALENH